MRCLVIVASALLAGCPTGPPTYVVPLAEMNAELHFGPHGSSGYDSRSIRIHEPGNGGDHCRVLSPRNSRATMDGTRGEMDPGGADNLFEPLECLDPWFSWDYSSPTTGPNTFVITDGSATWTFEIWQPFVYRSFELTSHAAAEPLRIGDTVTVTLENPGTAVQTVGTLSNARVVVTEDREELFAVSEGAGLTRTDTALSFVVPDVTTTAELRMTVTADFEYRVDRCEAPLGCRSVVEISDGFWIKIAPPS